VPPRPPAPPANSTRSFTLSARAAGRLGQPRCRAVVQVSFGGGARRVTGEVCAHGPRGGGRPGRRRRWWLSAARRRFPSRSSSPSLSSAPASCSTASSTRYSGNPPPTVPPPPDSRRVPRDLSDTRFPPSAPRPVATLARGMVYARCFVAFS
jgi:hypothetical protein